MKFKLVTCYFVLTFILNWHYANAQFDDAFVAEIAVGASSITADNTGNDILDYNGDTYEVSVWDDNSNTTCGLSWTFNGGSPNFTTLAYSPDAFDPDVCLVNDGNGIVFAIVTYYDLSGSDYYWEYFTWTGTVFSSGGASLFLSAAFGNTLNIDGNYLGDFIITWDDGAGNVDAITGSTPFSSVPALNNGGASVSVTTDGDYPDVSLAAADAQFVYIQGGGEIVADILRFSAMASGTGGPNVPPYYISSTPTGTYSYPRIACPASASADEFTFVVQEILISGSTNYLIEGFNSYSSTVTGPIVYNDGSTNPPGGTGIQVNTPSLFPVVTYSGYDVQPIWVGWVWDNRSNNYTGSPPYDAQYPIVLICDYAAIPLSHYLTVPLSSGIASQDVDLAFSISGRYAANNLYTFYESAGSDIYTKAISNAASGLRYGWTDRSQSDISESCAEFIISPVLDLNTEIISYQLLDVSGRILLQAEGNASDLLIDINTIKNNGLTGIFLLRINSRNINIYDVKKICLIR
jgi:hypothetical protein